MPTSAWIAIGVGVAVLFCIAMYREVREMNAMRRVRKEGEEVIAWLICANSSLYGPSQSEPGDHALPATVLVPSDPADGYDLEFMRSLCERTTDLIEGRRSVKEKERKFYREAKNEVYREGLWVKVPATWAGDGPPVYLTQLRIWRAHLPKGKLRQGRRYIRTSVIYDDPEAGVVHNDYHPDDDDYGPYHDRRLKCRQYDD